MTARADFVKKIEDELRKPKTEQNQDLLDFWNGQLVILNPSDGELASSISSTLAPALVSALVPALASALRSIIVAQNRRHRVVTASGSATGINTPASAAIGLNAIPVGGGRILTCREYEDAHRYFNLFAEALLKKYPDCFWFDPTEIKNHYLTFRLSSDWESYLAFARNGVGDYRLVNTPTTSGHFSVTYRHETS
eukprot:gene11436-12470_t